MDFSKFKKMFQGKRSGQIIFVLGIAGVLLIFLSNYLPKAEKKSADTEDKMSAYTTQLEAKLKDTIDRIQGVGKSCVLVTLDSGSEYIYAKEAKNTTDRSENTASNGKSIAEKGSGEEQYIIVKTDDGEQPLLITEIAPKVKGVVVVCTGGDDPQVAQRVKAAVTTALDITETRVCVTSYQK